jgi:hypothetical protein
VLAIKPAFDHIVREHGQIARHKAVDVMRTAARHAIPTDTVHYLAGMPHQKIAELIGGISAAVRPATACSARTAASAHTSVAWPRRTHC